MKMRLSIAAAALLTIALPLDAQMSMAGAPATARATATDAPTRTMIVPSAASGAIVAVAVPLAARGSTRWHVRPADGVRLLGADRGELTLAPDDSLLSLTFSLPRHQPAGPLRLATLHVQSAAGEEVIELTMHVRARRAVAVELAVADSALAGAVATGALRVRNNGTATDTIALRVEVDRGWRVEGVPAHVVLDAGAEREFSFRMRVPPDMPGWMSADVRVTVTGTDARAFRSAQLLVMPARGAGAARDVLPVAFTAGASRADVRAPGSTRTTFGLSATGVVGAGKHLDIMAQSNEAVLGAVLATAHQAQPLLRARVHTASWDVTLGDAGAETGLLPRFYAAGRGIEAEWRSGRVDTRAALLLARDGWSVARREGVASAGAGVTTGAGRFGAALLHATRAGERQGSARSAALQYHLFAGAHTLRAEAGWLESETATAGVQGGAAAEAAYRYTGARTALAASTRHAPETALLGGGVRAESTIDAALHMSQRVTAHAGVFSHRATTGDFSFFNELGDERVRVTPSARGGSAGFGWKSGRSSAGVSAQLHERTMLHGTELRRTATVRAGHAWGALFVDASFEAGDAASGDSVAPLRRSRGSLAYATAFGSLWATIEQSSEGPPLSMALNGSVRVRALELTALLNTFRDSLALPATSFATAASLAITATTSLRAGAEYRPWAPATASPWAASIAVRRSFALPVPGSSRHELSGILYEDVNGNGRRDADEPGLAGIPLRAGDATAVSDGAGRFHFPRAASRDVQIRQRDLAAGTMIRPGSTPGAGASLVAIAVVRTARITIVAVADDATTGESAPAAGFRVRVVDAAGQTREALTDSAGVAHFLELVPGAVRVTIEAAGSETAAEFTLAPGDARTERVNVRTRSRPVRYFSNTSDRTTR